MHFHCNSTAHICSAQWDSEITERLWFLKKMFLGLWRSCFGWPWIPMFWQFLEWIGCTTRWLGNTFDICMCLWSNRSKTSACFVSTQWKMIIVSLQNNEFRARKSDQIFLWNWLTHLTQIDDESSWAKKNPRY